MPGLVYYVDDTSVRNFESMKRQNLIDDLSTCGQEDLARKCARIRRRAARDKRPYGLEPAEAVELAYGIAERRGIFFH